MEEFPRKLTSVPLIPLRGPFPAPPKILGNAVIKNESSNRHLSDTKRPFVFCGLKNENREIELTDLCNVGILGKVVRTRPVQAGVQIIYDSIAIMKISKLYVSQGSYWVDAESVNEWTQDQSALDFWNEIKDLIRFISTTPIGHEWDLIRFATEDLENGIVPDMANQKLIWVCGTLLDARIYTNEQRQGLLECENPREALQYIQNLIKTILPQFKDTGVFTKGFTLIPS